MESVEARQFNELAARDAAACETCAGSGGLLLASGPDRHRGGGARCLRCAELDHLVFLPSSDGALTRRARRASGLTIVVYAWNTRRVRGLLREQRERLGVLVEFRALEAAAGQCLDDPAALADRRTRDARRASRGEVPWGRFAEAIRLRFPGCPRVEVIAYHVALRGIGPESLERAVAESVRHVDTEYDELLQAGVDRGDAFARVADAVVAVLDAWRAGAVPLDG